jgi:hypothetical protein
MARTFVQASILAFRGVTARKKLRLKSGKKSQIGYGWVSLPIALRVASGLLLAKT